MKVFVALVACIVAALVGVAAVVAGPDGTSEPSVPALREIPASLLPVYMAAATTCPGLPWQVLAAIGFHESGDGEGRVDPIDRQRRSAHPRTAARRHERQRPHSRSVLQ